MCNPRKVMIYLNRCIRESWRQSIEHCSTLSSNVSELATINAEVRLDAEMGEPALLMLERVLAGEFEGYEPWERNSIGEYRRQVEEVVLVYDSRSRCLRIEAGLTELVSAEARAAVEASGFTVGEVAVEAVGRYYDDGWGGRTKERAMKEAQDMAETRLSEAVEALHRQQHAGEIARAESQARARADEQAARELQRLQNEAREALRERLQYILARHQEQVNHVMYSAVGEAYRQTLRELVMENGGRIIADDQTGSVINMELELY